MVRKQKKFRVSKKLAISSVLAIIVLIVGRFIYDHYHNSPTQKVIEVSPTKTSQPTSNSPNAQVSGSDNVTSSSSGTDKQSPPAGGYGSSASQAGASLTVSAIGLVSNHYPGKNGSPTIETSVCNTTPGASCYIKFVKGNTSLQLQSGVADNSGSVYWNNWDVKNYGFSSGQWQITALSSLNGQTKTADDAIPLVIQ